MNCEICNKEIKLENSHSIVIVLQRIQDDGYSWFQCFDGNEYQHYGCCEDHMSKVTSSCINEHITGKKLYNVSQDDVKIHKKVFSSSVKCHCGADIKSDAYRFCLTRATPFTEVLGNTTDDLSSWCCSIEHARDLALSIIENI